jgi:hypothetical protein
VSFLIRAKKGLNYKIPDWSGKGTHDTGIPCVIDYKYLLKTGNQFSSLVSQENILWLLSPRTFCSKEAVMAIYNQKARDGIDWVQILVVTVAANLLGGLIFTLTEGLVPSWVVYPLLLIIGLGLLRRRLIIGAFFLLGSAVLFLLIHLPFTLLVGFKGSPCPDCSQPLIWITLFIIPLLTAFVNIMVWQQARRNESKKA